jgi:ankyrin repeat protein
LSTAYSLNDELLDAVFLHDLDDVRNLLARGANPDARDDERCTPLMMATVEDDTAIVRCLLEAGADPNLTDEDGWTALDVAVYRSRLDLVWLLLQYGAEVNAAPDTGTKVLVRAVFGGQRGLDTVAQLLPGWRHDGQLSTTVATAAGAAARFGASLDQPKLKSVH